MTGIWSKWGHYTEFAGETSSAMISSAREFTGFGGVGAEGEMATLAETGEDADDDRPMKVRL
jgi:hypothetical protein